jgi:hypothetical protein
LRSWVSAGGTGARPLILLGDRTPPYLSNKPIGLVSTAGGVQGLQTVNAMDFIARSLRGWSVPLVMPVPQSWQTFDADGRLVDDAIGDQLRALGAEHLRLRQSRARADQHQPLTSGQLGRPGCRAISTRETISSAAPKAIRAYRTP